MSAADGMLRPLSGRKATLSQATKILFVLALLGVWYVVTAMGWVSSFFLPRPERVFGTFWAILENGEAWEELQVTLFEYAIACPLAAVLGIAAGFLASRTSYRVRVFEPLLAGLYAIPIIVFYPLAVLFFGIGPESKIAHGVLFGFFPICLNTIQGFAKVDPVYLRLAASMGASPAQVLKRILLPAALPSILGGLRLGFMLTFLAIIGGETIASLAGLGHRIVWYAEGMETVKMFAYVIFVIIIAALMNLLLSVLERRWSPRT